MKVDISNLDMAQKHRATLREETTSSASRMMLRQIPELTWAVTTIPAEDGLMQLMGDHNESVAMIDKELRDVFGGPMLFYTRDRNLGTTDFCNVVEDLRWFHYDLVHIRGASELATVPAVTLNCLGDKLFCHQPNATPYKLLATAIHPDHPARIELPIGDLVGIPIVAVPALPSLPWRGRSLCNSMPAKLNPSIAMLNPSFTNISPGSIVIARKDGKAIHSKHVEALIKYAIAVAMGLSREEALEALQIKANAVDFNDF